MQWFGEILLKKKKKKKENEIMALWSQSCIFLIYYENIWQQISVNFVANFVPF